MRFLIQVIVNMVSLSAAAWLLSGISFTQATGLANQAAIVFVIALIFALVNTFIKPVIKFLAFPLYLVTLGLFGWFVNALMLHLTSWISNQIGWGLHVESLWSALIGALIVSVVGALTAAVIMPKDED